jgi:hypothetical protein
MGNTQKYAVVLIAIARVALAAPPAVKIPVRLVAPAALPVVLRYAEDLPKLVVLVKNPLRRLVTSSSRQSLMPKIELFSADIPYLRT